MPFIATESLSKCCFHFAPSSTKSKDHHHLEYTPLFQEEHQENVKLRRDLYLRSSSLLLHSYNQLFERKRGICMKEFEKLMESCHQTSNVCLIVVPSDEYCHSFPQCAFQLKALKAAWKAAFDVGLSKFVVRIMGIEGLSDSQELHRMILWLSQREKPSILIVVSPIGTHSLGFMRRETLLHCSIDVILGEEAVISLPKGFSFVSQKEIHKELHSFLESLLFNEQFPLMNAEFLGQLIEEFEQNHLSLEKTMQRIKLCLLEYFWGNPFSCLQAAGSIRHASKSFLEFARMQPSFMQFVDECLAEETSSVERAKVFRVLENDSYFVKALPSIVQAGYPAQMKELCQFLAIFSEYSPLHWYLQLAKCNFSYKPFVDSLIFKVTMNHVISLPICELVQILSSVSRMEFDFEDAFTSICNSLLDELAQLPSLVEDERENMGQWRIKKRDLQNEIRSQVQCYFEPSFVFCELLILGGNKNLSQLTLQMMHPDFRQGIDWALSMNSQTSFAKMYALWKEYGRRINTHDWFIAFQQQFRSDSPPPSSPTQKDSSSQVDQHLLALFLHHVNEFEFLGLVERVGCNMNVLKRVI